MHTLSSPGQSTAARVELEAELSSVMMRELRAFLVDVERLALAPSTTLTASLLDHFTLGPVLNRWERAARSCVAPVARRFGILTDTDRAVAAHPYLGPMLERMRRSDLPEKAYSAARAVLTDATVQNWDDATTARALSNAMDAWTSTLVPGRDGPVPEGMSWAAQMRRIARTEATTAHNFHTLEQLSAQGYTDKRWVAHHDEITRDTHLQADGQTIPLMVPFIVGGEAVQVPGDPAGSPAVSYNCRCVIVGADSSLTASYNPDQPRDSKGRWAMTMSVTQWSDLEQSQYAEMGGTAVGEAVGEYANGLYEPINEYCRHGGDPRELLNGSQSVTDYTELLDEGFDIVPGLPNTVLVYRGTRGFDPPSEFIENGFLSTSIDRRLAENFGKVVTIIVPKGTPVLTGNTGEHELIFPRGGLLTRRAPGVYEWSRS
jgi:hypothetical protein